MPHVIGEKEHVKKRRSKKDGSRSVGTAIELRTDAGIAPVASPPVLKGSFDVPLLLPDGSFASGIGALGRCRDSRARGL
jgi:hypothetical protein